LWPRAESFRAIVLALRNLVKGRKTEPAVAYTIIAKCPPLLGDRFTAVTVCEALDRVQRIRSRGFLVTIAVPDGEPINEDELEAEAAGIRSLMAGLGASLDALAVAVNRRTQEPPAKGLDLDDAVQRRRFMDGDWR
jgi:hypothetical protein